MARIVGVTKGGSLLTRIAFFMTKRRLGRVVKPVRIYALHSRLLRGYAHMELAQDKARRVRNGKSPGSDSSGDEGGLSLLK